jgi:soluble lytic murein transglycosylase-like protein
VTPAYTQVATELATAYRLPPDLILSQILVESSGDQFAFRYERAFFVKYILAHPERSIARYGPLAACSYGLLQILLATAVDYGFLDQPWMLFQPRIGLNYGLRYLAVCWQAVGGTDADLAGAVACYNGGLALAHVPASSWPDGVKTYVDRVFQGRTPSRS